MKPETKYLEVKFKDLEVSVGARVEVQLEISDAVTDFLLEYLNQTNKVVSSVFSRTLIEEKPKWTLQTVNEFFAFIKRRRDIEELRSVVTYNRPVNVLMLMDWVVIYEEECRAKPVVVESVPGVGKASPEKVSIYVKEALAQIPKSQYTPPRNPLTQDDFKQELRDMIPTMKKKELHGLLENLKKENVLRTDEDNKPYVEYYYEFEIEMINKRLK